MPTRPVPFSEIKRTVELWHEALAEGYPANGGPGGAGALRAVKEQLGFQGTTTDHIRARLDTAVALGISVGSWPAIDPGWAAQVVLRYKRLDEEFRAAEMAYGRVQASDRRAPSPSARTGRGRAASTVPSSEAPSPDRLSPSREPPIANASAHSTPTATEIIDQIVPVLRRGPLTLENLAARLGVAPNTAGLALEVAHARGASIVERAGLWHLDNAPAMGSQQEHEFKLVTDKDGRLTLGATSDQHLASKYCRLDCLNDYYDELARREIKIVLNGGNWIDGEAIFNRHDILVHGMDAQLQYLAENYPKREGMETWAIAGADHEGFYSRREGVDIGRYAQNVMRQHGRTDWHDMGYMECFIPLVHGDTGAATQLCLMHPGGGSAYAISYAPQKIIEGFSGGDKPSVLLLGHYHKASYQLTRNVHCVQLSSFQDQTVFMRQKKISSEIGGWILSVKLDPKSGAIVEFSSTYRPYFIQGYYNNRWSQHGPVTFAERRVEP